MVMFLKNLAITGGLLSLVANGAGGWSMDGRKYGIGGRREASLNLFFVLLLFTRTENCILPPLYVYVTRIK
jgi:hypothetical protein